MTRRSASLEIVGRVIDGLVGAVLRGERELVVRRCAGDHPRAHDLAELDRGDADAARGAQHGQRLAGLEVGAVLQRVERRAVGHAHAGRAVEIRARRES